MPSLKKVACLVSIFLISSCSPSNKRWVATAPAGSSYTKINPGGVTVLPNGRHLTPRGISIRVAPHPYGLALSADGQTIVTANSGVGPFSLTIIENASGAEPRVRQIPEGAETDEGILAAVFMGTDISESGDIFEDSYIGDLVLSKDGKFVFAVDQTNFRVVIADTESLQIVRSVGVGRYPFGITLTPDGRRLYVANVGMYEYSVLEGVDPEANPPRLGSAFPAAAQGSSAARDGVDVEGYHAPGLGDPNAPESFSVWGLDVSDPLTAEVISKTKTGILVGEQVEDFPTVGGSSPNSLVSTNEFVFVSNGNNDSVSIIDIAADSVLADIRLQLDPRLDGLRGQIPFGLALAPDGRRLYVAEAGINAVAVIDVASRKVLGHIPTGWFPSKIKVTPDGQKLVVTNAKGWGSGPNGGPDFERGREGSYIGNLMFGFVSIMDIPSDDQLATETQQVIDNNFDFHPVDDEYVTGRIDNPIPAYSGGSGSPIKHIVFITKENRTYDEVFGEVTKGRGEPTLARYGRNASFSNKDGSLTASDISVMPNHQALANQFGIADNFYCDSDVSADGHRWLVGVYPNEWVETSVAASYGGGRSMNINSSAPGMLAFVGSSGAIYPEDYNEAGSVWDHLIRNGVEFFNFGLGFEFAPGVEEQEFKYTGIRNQINYPMPGPLFSRTSKKFATYNTSIPDQFRTDMFIEEFEERWAEGAVGAEPLPPVITLMLPNDHGAGERPEDGYPFVESYMADNDLALGRIVDYLSHTKYWEDMAIIVTEDDMVISPYARKDYVSNVHFSFGSIWKTVWHVMGTPYLNQYDAGATDLADFFQPVPDFTPYATVLPDPLVFDPQKALDPFDADFNWDALSKSPIMDDVETMKKWAREAEEAENGENAEEEDAAGDGSK